MPWIVRSVMRWSGVTAFVAGHVADEPAAKFTTSSIASKADPTHPAIW
jgi:hypothetical protein